MNWGTFIVGAVVLVILGGIVFSMMRNRAKGKNSCGCGCSGCAMSDHCHGSRD